MSIDITGHRYGHLTVLEFAEAAGGNDGNKWRCLCDCGQETVARAKDLRLGTTTSCGCRRHATGKVIRCKSRGTAVKRDDRFGMLTVTRLAPDRGDGLRHFYCRCDCGASTVVRANLLTTGQTRSCGCLAGRGQKRRAA